MSTPGLLIRHRGNYFLLWIGWSLFYLYAVVPLGSLALKFTHKQINTNSPPRLIQDQSVSGEFSTVRHLRSDRMPTFEGVIPSDPVYQLDYSASSVTRASELAAGSIELSFQGAAATAKLQIDLVDRSWVLFDAQSAKLKSGIEFNREALVDLFSAHGMDTVADEIQAEIDSLARQIGEVVENPKGRLRPTSQSGDLVRCQIYSGSVATRPMPPRAVFGLKEGLMILGLIGYTLGLVLLIRRRGRLLRQTEI
ncbi:MAG: hypothetical protein ACIAQ0_08175 [Phycisphaerales bacterium JB058]